MLCQTATDVRRRVINEPLLCTAFHCIMCFVRHVWPTFTCLLTAYLPLFHAAHILAHRIVIFNASLQMLTSWVVSQTVLS